MKKILLLFTLTLFAVFASAQTVTGAVSEQSSNNAAEASAIKKQQVIGKWMCDVPVDEAKCVMYIDLSNRNEAHINMEFFMTIDMEAGDKLEVVGALKYPVIKWSLHKNKLQFDLGKKDLAPACEISKYQVVSQDETRRKMLQAALDVYKADMAENFVKTMNLNEMIDKDASIEIRKITPTEMYTDEEGVILRRVE